MMGLKNRNVIWALTVASTLSVAQTDSAAVDSAAFAVVIPPKKAPTSWDVSGNVNYSGSYHYVRTRTNHGEALVTDKDTVKNGQRFKNYYQVPGLNAVGSAYVRAESPDGKVIEFDANAASDEWNNFNANTATLKYSDGHNNIVLGDFFKSNGEIYMDGLPILGFDYTLSLLKNDGDESMIELDAFYGEAQRPLLVGNKHPYLYNEYIEDGEAAAQKIAFGGSLKFAPIQKFNIALGGIYSNDEIESPLLRNGASSSTLTSDPLQESLTFFADATYNILPKDAKLNLQVAMGRADTTDVIRERAVNSVFSNAGIYSSNYTTLRSLMQNESRISRLSKEELDEIFGENNTLTKKQLQDSLKTLIRQAKKVQRETERNRDEDRTFSMNWGDQNLAFDLNGEWNYKSTSFSAFVKYIGEDFYSAGSPDQISDSREFGVNLDQGLLDVWDFNLKYNLLIENAAIGKKINLFGLGEGTRHGLFADTDTQWNRDHERDLDRTRYTQNAGLTNTFHVGKQVDIHAGYEIEHFKQYRPYQLHAIYTEESKVYADKWFAAREGYATTKYDTGDSTIEIDKERWSAYKALEGEDNIASRFQERIFKHTWNAGFMLHRGSTTLNAHGRVTWRIDASKFLDDDLVQEFDFENKTWGKLGYFYGEADYIEQSYPIVATTVMGSVQNRVSITPRFKNYTNVDMEESEYTLNDELEVSFMNEFLTLSLSGEFRHMILTWDDEGSNTNEIESDFLGNIGIRFNHSKQFFSEWFFGTGIYYRPDNMSNEYKDIYGGVNLGYSF